MEEECRAVDANQAQILTRLGRKGMVGLEVSGREGRVAGRRWNGRMNKGVQESQVRQQDDDEEVEEYKKNDIN